MLRFAPRGVALRVPVAGWRFARALSSKKTGDAKAKPADKAKFGSQVAADEVCVLRRPGSKTPAFCVRTWK